MPLKRGFIHETIMLLSLLACSFSQPAAEAECPKTGLAVQVPQEARAIALTNLEASSWDYLAARFLLENRTSKEIAYLSLVLQYRNKDSDSLSVVYEAAPDTAQPSAYLIPAEYVQPLPHPLLPGHKKWISGSSPYTLPGCPSSARLTMLDLHFEDRSSLKWESPGWSTSPLLADYPETLSISDSNAWNAAEYFLLAKVNAQGQVEKIVPIAPTAKLPSETVPESLQKLTFYPALTDGKADLAYFILRLKFERPKNSAQNNSPLQSPSIRKPSVLMVFSQPQDNPGDNWYFEFGHGFGFKTRRSLHEP